MANSNIEAVYRLSPVQEGLLFHTLESTNSGVYFEQYSCLLLGSLDSEQYRAAWKKVMQRHPALRTLFTWEGRDQPLQIVRQSTTLPWTQMDWSDVSADTQQSRNKALIKRERDRGFDLEQAPLFRLILIHLKPGCARLLWSFHHLLLDGWSMRVIMKEVMIYYHDLVSNRETEFPSAPPYINFIRWLEQRDRSQEQTFWTETLAGYNQLATLLPDCAYVEKQSAVAEFTRLELTADTRLQFESFAKRQQITLNTLMVGAWAIILGRYCKSDDVVFGTTVSGRPPELDSSDKIVGLFINTLPFRAKLREQVTVAEWLREIQSLQLKMRSFEHTPLTAIQRWSDLPAGGGLFESILVYENFPSENAQNTANSELRVSDENYIEYSHYPVAILIVPGQTIQLIAVHNTKLYSVAFAHRILEQLQTILLEISNKPDSFIDELSLISETERHSLLKNWNGTQVEFPEASTIHQLIEKTAERARNMPAVICEAEQLNYQTLNARANQLSRYLLGLGVDKQLAVPVLLNRSVDTIVAILAVLKAGSAYIPLDPGFAEGRISAVYDDLLNNTNKQATDGKRLLVISKTDFIEKLPIEQVQIICLNRDWSIIASNSEENPDVQVSLEQLAYIMYTSGSTGRPKGVMISHANLLNSTLARSDYYQEDFDSYLLLSSLATDSSVAGIFWSLTEGATLVLPEDRIEQDIYKLVDRITRLKISHLLCLPSLYQVILDHAERAQLESLKLVIVAGEACHRDVLKAHCQCLPQTALYNEYGPSEACVWTSVARLDQLQQQQRINIGKPINNQQIFILDEQQCLAPVGVAGELCISGAGLARGYLNQPGKTAESFIPHPFDNNDDARLYRSGDMARYLADGNIEFLGRVDNQVKIRGFRVELQEIEEVLLQHPDVNETVVLVDDGSSSLPSTEKLLSDLSTLESQTAEQLLASIEKLDQEQIESALRNSHSGEQVL